jgi:hypothetical protein
MRHAGAGPSGASVAGGHRRERRRRDLRDARAAVKMPAMAIPNVPRLAPGAHSQGAKRSAAHGSGRVLLASAALVLGIGSCQLPQPHVPTLWVGGLDGLGTAVAAPASTLAGIDRG